MRHAGARPLVRRNQAIDQALRARKWPTDKTLAKDLEVDPRTIRRDLEFMRDGHQFGQRVARTMCGSTNRRPPETDRPTCVFADRPSPSRMGLGMANITDPPTVRSVLSSIH
jgi:hypothetical protein